MEELYDILNQSDSTILSGIGKDEFISTFNTPDGINGLYDILSSTDKGSVAIQGIEKEEFISAFSTPEARNIEDNYFDLGVLNNTWIGDWVDDMGRAIARGNRSGDSVNETLGVMLSGADVSEEKLNKFIEVQKHSEELGSSDEMNEFIGNGGFETWKGWKSFLNASATIIPEVMAESMSAMFGNTTTGGIIGGGAAVGAAGAGVSLLGTMPVAMGLASGTLETTSKFGEELKKVVSENGLEFDEDGIKSILEDEELFNDLVSKSLAKGITIGAIDAISGGIAGKIGAKAVKLSGKARKLKVVQGAAVEGVGGGLGEGLGQVISGEPLDVTNIGLEIFPDVAQSGVTMSAGAISQVLKDKRNENKIPDNSVEEDSGPIEINVEGTELPVKEIDNEGKYIINGENVSKSELDKILKIYENSDKETEGLSIDVTNDDEVSQRVGKIFNKENIETVEETNIEEDGTNVQSDKKVIVEDNKDVVEQDLDGPSNQPTDEGVTDDNKNSDEKVDRPFNIIEDNIIENESLPDDVDVNMEFLDTSGNSRKVKMKPKKAQKLIQDENNRIKKLKDCLGL